MRVTTYDQLLELLDGLYADGADRTSRVAAGFWDALLLQEDHPSTPTCRTRPGGVEGRRSARGPVRPHGARRGCGLGRNSRWLATQDFAVTGVDIAPQLIDEAARRSQGQATAYVQRDFVREDVAGAPFDLVYDSGCFHHLAPHRRISYMEALESCLTPGGLFGICTFAAGRMGTDAADRQLLHQRSLEGGVGYTLDELREMFSWLEVLDARRMPAQRLCEERVFTHDFLNVVLFRRSAIL